jgi:predicted metal-dependent hydrolase
MYDPKSFCEIPEWLQVGEEVLPLRITRNHRAKRICLRYIPTDHAISLTLPRHTRVADGLNFLNLKSQWLIDTLHDMPCKKQIKPGVVLPMFGERVRIRHEPAQRGSWKLNEGVLMVSGDRDLFQRRVVEALKKIAKRQIAELAIKKAKIVGRDIARISVRDTRSRWGSCSSTGNLSFSWRLIFAPYEVFEYVVAHEVAHLRHMNHSPRFWALVELLCPGHEVAKAWLRLHGRDLYRFNA